MKRVYIAADSDPLICSMCDQEKELLARIPIKNWAGPRAEVEPWFGLCESCVAGLLQGFAVARKNKAK